MKARYSFSSRHTKRATDSKKMRKQKQPYPLVLKKIIDQSDIILQVLDIRYIEGTRNKDIEADLLRKGKKVIYVLNKADLIRRPKKEELKEINPKVFVSCTKRKGVKDLRDLIKREAKKIDKPLDKKFDKIVVGVMGYPNTGKSSLINVLVGKKVAGTGAEAGFTRGAQKLKLTNEIHLLDSPGVIPQKEYSSVKKEALAKHTIVGGRSFSQVRDPEMVIDTLIKEFRGTLEHHYKINAKGNAEILLETLGNKWNYLKKGGFIDEDKVARRILKEWQAGEIKV